MAFVASAVAAAAAVAVVAVAAVDCLQRRARRPDSPRSRPFFARMFLALGGNTLMTNYGISTW